MTRNMKFSHKILLAAALVVAVAFACFILFNDYRQREALQSSTEASMQELGSLTTSNIQTWLESRIQLLQSMSQQVVADGNAPASLKRIIDLPAYTGNFQLSYFGGADGVMFSVPAGNRAPDYDPRARGWYKAANAAQQTIVTEPYIAASSGKLVITVATPVQRQGQMIGVAGADIDLSSVSAIINSLNFGGHGHAFIVSADGKILIHPDSKLVLKTLAEAYPNGAPNVSPGLKEVEFDGKTQLISFTRVNGVPSADWYVALVLDKDTAFSMLSEFRTSALIAMVIAVVIIIALLGMLIRVLMQPLLTMGRAMHDIAEGEGDLTKRLTIHGHDEFGALGLSFNRFVERIHTSIREVSSATGQVNEVALRVVAASNSSMFNSDQQASRTNSVAAAINQLGAAAQEIAQNAALASQHSSDARSLAEDGQQVVDKTIHAMQQLSAKISDSCGNIETLNSNTVNIGQILEVITSISQQTNLLALNAAIEAARAGEAGRGFAVVADEVRNLAHRTQDSAQQVQKMIEELQVGARQAVGIMTESQRESESSVGIANQAGERLGSVTQRIGEIDGMNQSVATATEEQTAVVESINVDINEINTLNQEGVENLQATLRACADLEQQAARLKQLVGSFRI
ncbi:methyl-accepting chemotaxis protein [Pseudomonas fluorescens]|uniref:Putative methyl-accepting chemotaxis protein n=1 Tax=Pseudomonas fluorescens (strain Pf0-1) TaxID=205922 RepID=Q3KJF8_PSEPF|nr:MULTISPECIES: methyl-accepting chemotaxis protein [Pseudomonas]ABA72098.1 putative methyl-accepting chemotaxis protein [Pseudomonas fluorescens Pf0-1]MBX8623889.1 methyl-accepting chemotaxis protein [Pseudomonas glycinae]MBY9023580.1 methyl-accepting chemotaxis protein [Pseudomonas fluorescens]MBY9029572.1 methyl-accepting chemotaxis protein [Pseudomonas fluorescens]MBY9035420.1 methyl-accepting chemotaxis protein [Pseudomonas fluorescens]